MTIVSTPLYSNTTLVAFLPTLARMAEPRCSYLKFDAGEFLRLSETHRASHAMLVPVQYHIMERGDFGQYDLSSYVLKLSASAPLSRNS